MKKLLTLIAFSIFSVTIYGQIIIFPIPIGLISKVMPEHGFLPGTKFKLYPTILRNLYHYEPMIQIKKLIQFNYFSFRVKLMKT